MTKQDPRKKPHVALQRLKYTGGDEPRYIDPHPEDPQLGEQFTLEHLTPMVYEVMVDNAFELFVSKPKPQE